MRRKGGRSGRRLLLLLDPVEGSHPLLSGLSKNECSLPVRYAFAPLLLYRLRYPERFALKKEKSGDPRPGPARDGARFGRPRLGARHEGPVRIRPGRKGIASPSPVRCRSQPAAAPIFCIRGIADNPPRLGKKGKAPTPRRRTGYNLLRPSFMLRCEGARTNRFRLEQRPVGWCPDPTRDETNCRPIPSGERPAGFAIGRKPEPEAVRQNIISLVFNMSTIVLRNACGLAGLGR